MNAPRIRIHSSRPRRSTGRRLVTLLLATAGTLLAVELLSVLVYPLTAEQPHSRSGIQQRLAERARAAPASAVETALGERTLEPEHILHPYTGFSYDTRRDPDVNAFGFTGESPIVKRGPDRLNVALLGGSVARELYLQAGEQLGDLLAESARYRDRKVHLICLAVDGFKQPQALLALTFAVYLGAEYDFVVNLDGFNEVVLPITDNVPNRVFPHYPRIWNLYADKGLSLSHIAQVAALVSIRERQQRLSRVFSESPLRFSNFMLILWESLDRRYENAAQQSYVELVEQARLGNPDASYGPPPDPEQPPQVYARDAADRWAQASLQMHDLAQTNGARYFHFLQPNQYVPGSKVFSAWEKRFADIDGDASQRFPYHASVQGYKPAARLGYPLLIENGAELRKRGVRFVDLTGIFADVRETIYRDACCHYNKVGYAMLAERMAQEILRGDAGDAPRPLGGIR